LKVEGVFKFFGKLAAVTDVSFQVLEGEAVGIMGPNGAGKSTLLSLISGELRPDRGRVLFKGRPIHGLKVHEICRMGIARASQIPQPFLSMSVRDNVAVAAIYGGRNSWQKAREVTEEVLEIVGLTSKADSFAGELTEVELKRLELARALATGPELMLLDEIAAGLTEEEIPEVMGVLNALRKRGLTYILVEHVIDVLVNVVDRIIVMKEGQKIAEGDVKAVMDDERVIEAYFGKREGI